MYNSPRTKKKSLNLSNSCYKHREGHDHAGTDLETKELLPFISCTETLTCVFCKRPTAPLIKIPSGIFINLTGHVHELCLKNKACCECGVLGLCNKCTARDCNRLIHSWCAEAMHANPNLCDLHSNTQKKKESSKVSFIKSICRRVISSNFWEKEYKEKDSPSSMCNGHTFWYIINLEYFPLGFDLFCFPNFPIANQFELQYESRPETSNYVDQMINKVSTELDCIRNGNSKKIESLMMLLDRKKTGLEGLDINQSLDFSDPGCKSDKVIENESACCVCMEANYEETIINCKKCTTSVHPKCYKNVSNSDWVCELCKSFSSDAKISCALCPKKGGAMKQTLHLIKDSLFPNYPPIHAKGKKDAKDYIWVHAFCALHTPGVVFKSTGIDLSGIDNTKLNLQCDVCKSKDGACLQCNFNRCCSAFHPECGKDLFVSTKTNEKKIYCALHKPLKLRKMLEIRHKKIAEDIYKFCKAMEKYLNKVKTPIRVIKRKRCSKIRSLNGKIFSQDEDLALEYRIQQFLYKLNLSQKKPFTVSINLQASTRCSRVSVTRPNNYTMIQPSVILEEGITIENRSPEECFKRYQDTLFSKLKNEILLIGNRLSLYQGKDIQPIKHYIRHKKKPSEYSLRVSSDTYCICDQPYYYEIPWIADWTQDQWEEKIRDNEMVECTKCEKWYHLKCVGYDGSLEKAREDENWKCGICDKKKVEKAKYLDQKSIISDINQGVVTRRGTKIH
jgi:PHD-zinc-finger like domain/PHD-finger